jgi:hypothetical protein
MRYDKRMNRRLVEYTEQQFRDAVAQAVSWRGVMEALGMHRSNPGIHVKQDVARLGIDVSHFDPRFSKAAAVVDLPFKRPPVGGSTSGLSIAARWFLDRGYHVSIPMEPTTYDLITESDSGLQRVQVKTTNQRSPASGIRLTRAVYDASVNGRTRGSYREVPYAPSRPSRVGAHSSLVWTSRPDRHRGRTPCGRGGAGSAPPCQGGGHGFKSRRPLSCGWFEAGQPLARRTSPTLVEAPGSGPGGLRFESAVRYGR